MRPCSSLCCRLVEVPRNLATAGFRCVWSHLRLPTGVRGECPHDRGCETVFPSLGPAGPRAAAQGDEMPTSVKWTDDGKRYGVRTKPPARRTLRVSAWLAAILW
jgi:hypothetical protein